MCWLLLLVFGMLFGHPFGQLEFVPSGSSKLLFCRFSAATRGFRWECLSTYVILPTPAVSELRASSIKLGVLPLLCS